jgi:leucyl-tRNA---protein transferase
MNYEVHCPDTMPPELLDEYLAKGWYRNGQKIFTSDFVPHEEGMSPVIWLRFDLTELSLGARQRALWKRGQRFQATVQPLVIDDEFEALYAKYRASIDFDACLTARDYLVEGGTAGPNMKMIYQSEVIAIRDDGKLIAIGVFDQGKTSLAGILNFFDPDYKKYSLGKWLMIKKITIAHERGHRWYYPGYVAYGFSKFDYKFFPDPGAAQLYDPTDNKWVPHSEDTLTQLAHKTSLSTSLQSLLRMMSQSTTPEPPPPQITEVIHSTQ